MKIGLLNKKILDSSSPYRTLSITIFVMLFLLWLVSIILMLTVFSSNTTEPNKKLWKSYSLDNMLLSFAELKLGTNTTLINLQLKEVSHVNTTTEEEKEIVANNRKKIYDKILEQKIEQKTADVPDRESQGFTIKPVPQ